MKIVESRTSDERDSTSTQTWVLAVQNNNLCIAAKAGYESSESLEKADPSRWRDENSCIPPLKTNPANLHPASKPLYHRYRPRHGESKDDVFEKKYDLIGEVLAHQHIRTLHDGRNALIKKREVETCEYLRKYPHPNVAKYRGVRCVTILLHFNRGKRVMVDLGTERVIKLMSQRYDDNLWGFVKDGHRVYVEHCLSFIEAGIKHLHSLGYVHSDIKPENIFVSREANGVHYVVGDFDSCHHTDNQMVLKSGDLAWTKPKADYDFAGEDDDWWAFGKLEGWLRSGAYY